MVVKTSRVPDPSVLDPWVADMQENARLARTLMGGTKAMQKAGEKYLPKNPHEFDDDYDYRLATAHLRNYFKRTVQNTTGKLFAKPFQVEGGLPVIEPITWDIDRAGTDIQAFARDLTIAALGGCGMALFLVDRDNGGDTSAYADQQRKTAPYWANIDIMDLIALRTQVVNGEQSVAQLRYRRTVEKVINEFETAYVEQIRVVEPDQYRIYERIRIPRTQRWVWTVVGGGPNTLGKVTLVPVYLGRTGFFQAENPINDLADMNLELWQIRSEQRRSLQVNSFPMLVALNYDGDLKDIVIGPNSITGLKGEKSELKFIESNGRHLEAGRMEINDLIDQMRAFGAQFDKPGEVGTVESASGRMIDAQEATTTLQLWALSLKDSIEMGLGYTVEWLGGNPNKLEDTGTVNMSLDFTKVLSEAAIKLLIEVRKLGDLSRRNLLEPLRQNSMLPEDFDYNKNDQELEDDPMAIPKVTQLPKPAAE
jgi:hypothetical protein